MNYKVRKPLVMLLAPTLFFLALLVQPFAAAQGDPAFSDEGERLVVFEIFTRGA